MAKIKQTQHFIIKNNDTGKYFGFTKDNAHVLDMDRENAHLFKLESAKNLVNGYSDRYPNLVIIDIAISADEDMVVYRPETKKVPRIVEMKTKPSVKTVYDYKEGDIRCDDCDSIKELVESIINASKALNLISQNAPRTLSAIDSEVNNILHEIELFPDMNAREGYLMYKKLRTALRRRRSIKNSIEVLEAARINNVTSVASNLESANKLFSKKKVYHKRVIDTTLFTDYE